MVGGERGLKRRRGKGEGKGKKGKGRGKILIPGFRRSVRQYLRIYFKKGKVSLGERRGEVDYLVV
jgi:hypothetical protein